MEEKLKYIYDDVYRWLVFAETKNVAFVTILLVLIERVSNSSWAIQWCLFKYCILGFVVGSSIILVSSFVPYLDNCIFLKKCIKKKYYKKFYNRNTLFYGRIFFEVMERKYTEVVKTKYNNDAELTDFEKDLLDQIGTISEMILIKTWFFESAMKTLIIGVCFTIIISVCCV